MGGVIHQVRLLVVRVRNDYASRWAWSFEESAPKFSRPMSNLLTPPGLFKPHTYVANRTGDPIAWAEPMPAKPRAFIQTEVGSQRLLLEETARGVGLPKEWGLELKMLQEGLLEWTTSIFLWEYLSTALTRPEPPPFLDVTPLSFEELRDTTRPTGILDPPGRRTSSGAIFVEAPKFRTWRSVVHPAPPGLHALGFWNLISTVIYKLFMCRACS